MKFYISDSCNSAVCAAESPLGRLGPCPAAPAALHPGWPAGTVLGLPPSSTGGCAVTTTFLIRQCFRRSAHFTLSPAVGTWHDVPGRFSDMGSDFWVLLCEARSWTRWSLWIPSNSGYSVIHCYLLSWALSLVGVLTSQVLLHQRSTYAYIAWKLTCGFVIRKRRSCQRVC